MHSKVNENERADFSIYKLYYPHLNNSEKFISYLCWLLESTIHVEPIGIHRVGDAIEFAVRATPQDEDNLNQFFININGVDIYLLKDDEDILIVNSCGNEFRETIEEISKTLTDNAKVVNYYRQLRKYNGRYKESGTITFWIKDIRTPLTHKIDKRRRCYFNDEKHFNLLSSPPERTPDLNTDEDTEPMADEGTLEGSFASPAVTPPPEAEEVTEVADELADEPPVNRATSSPIPLNPDLAPEETGGESREIEPPDSATAPPLAEIKVIPTTTPPVHPQTLEGSFTDPLPYRFPEPTLPVIPPYPWQAPSRLEHGVMVDLPQKYHWFQGITLNYDQNW